MGAGAGGPGNTVGGTIGEVRVLNASSQALNQLLLPNCGSKGYPSAITELMPRALSDRGFLIPYLRFILNRRFISPQTGSHKAAPNHPVRAGVQRATVSIPLPTSAIFTGNFRLISLHSRRQFLPTFCSSAGTQPPRPRRVNNCYL